MDRDLPVFRVFTVIALTEDWDFTFLAPNLIACTLRVCLEKLITLKEVAVYCLLTFFHGLIVTVNFPVFVDKKLSDLGNWPL